MSGKPVDNIPFHREHQQHHRFEGQAQAEMAAVDGFSIPHIVLRHFDLTSTPYTEGFARKVEDRRQTYPDGRLFLDQLLALASIDGPTYYPPLTPAALRRLIHTIRAAPVDRLKQDCFLYYLLLDYDHAADLPNGHSDSDVDHGSLDASGTGGGASGSGSELVRSLKGKEKETHPRASRAEEFARRRCLPGMWRGFIYGYWALDQGMWEEAGKALSNPAITSVNFVPAIFTVISKHVSPPSRCSALIHTLFVALAPVLETEAMVALRATSIAFASLSDSFGFIRSRSVDDQPKLREHVWCWALGAPRIPCGAGQGGVQPGVLTQLLHLPLLPDESAHLTRFLIHPPRSLSPASLDLLHELVTVRLIHQGQYAECLALDKELAGSGVGREEDRQKRRERVQEFISILPEAQRRVLALDAEVRREQLEVDRRPGLGEVNGYMPDEDVDMPSNREDNLFSPQTSTGPKEILQPIPSRLPQLSVLAGTASGPALPSPAARRIASTVVSRNVSSPFSGPPQFARTGSPGPALQGTPGRASPALIPRLASGSPFAQPPKPAVDVPRPVRRIINDDDDENDPLETGSVAGRRKVSRHRQASTSSRVEVGQPRSDQASQQDQADVMHGETRGGANEDVGKEMQGARAGEGQEDQPAKLGETDTREAQDTAAQENEEGKRDRAEPRVMPPPPVPSRGLRASRSSNALAKTPTAARRAPRRPSGVQQPAEDIPEDGPAEEEQDRQSTHAPLSPAASTHSRASRRQSAAPPSEGGSDIRLTETMPGAFGLGSAPVPSGPSGPSGRSRITRSASRAVLDDEDQPAPGPTPKKARTTTTTTTGKSTNKAASPTPSEARSAVRRSTRRTTREPSVAEVAEPAESQLNGLRNGGSPTPSVSSVASSTRSSSRRPGVREGSMTPRVTRTRR